jgi:hypothetical protein
MRPMRNVSVWAQSAEREVEVVRINLQRLAAVHGSVTDGRTESLR